MKHIKTRTTVKNKSKKIIHCHENTQTPLIAT